MKRQTGGKAEGDRQTQGEAGARREAAQYGGLALGSFLFVAPFSGHYLVVR